MKTSALITTIHTLGITTFLLFVAIGTTAHATMIGITILVGWTTLSMLAIELRRPVLELESAATATRHAHVGSLMQMPMPVRSAA